MVQMVNKRARLGYQDGDTAVATAAAQDALTLAQALPPQYYNAAEADDWIARAHFWAAIVEYYADGDLTVAQAHLDQVNRNIPSINDADVRQDVQDWVASDRMSGGVNCNRQHAGYRKALPINRTWLADPGAGASP